MLSPSLSRRVAEGRGGVVKLSFTIPRLPRITVKSFAETSLPPSLALESLEGKKFRRQHGIGPYFADSHCPECCLVVELDGPRTPGPLEIERDETRTTYLKELGIRVSDSSSES